MRSRRKALDRPGCRSSVALHTSPHFRWRLDHRIQGMGGAAGPQAE